MARFQHLTKTKSVSLFVLIVAMTGCILFLLAEFGIRVRHYIKFGAVWGIEDTFMMDETANLRVLIPNKQFGAVRINSLGFRGPEIPLPKPDSVIRIAFLGASTTYCAEVLSNDMVWTHLVTEQLKQRWPSLQFDYVSGGVPGYGVNHSLQNLKYKIAPLKPDIIVIYHTTNDLSSNTFELAKKKGLVEQQTEQGMLWLSKYSLLSYLVEKNLRLIISQKKAFDQSRKLEFETQEITEPFRNDLNVLVQESKKVSPIVAIATFSVRLRENQSKKDKIEAAVTSLYYMPYMTIDGLIRGYKSYNDVIRSVAHQQNIILIDNNTMIPGDGTHFNDSVHFKDRGSALMARRVFTGLVDASTFESFVEARANNKEHSKMISPVHETK